MTKPIVSVAVLQLVEHGLLQLDDPVAKYLPEFARCKRLSYVNGKKTLIALQSIPSVRDLLRHTSGLTYELVGSGVVQREYIRHNIASRKRSNREFSQQLSDIPFLSEPGLVWEYSRSTDLLAALIEVVSGQTLGLRLKQHLLDPLAMYDTGFFVPVPQHHRIAEPPATVRGISRVELIDVRAPVKREAGGMGLVSTAVDYANFLQCLLRQGVYKGVQILQAETVDCMTSDHKGAIPVYPAGRSKELLKPDQGFGLGVAVQMKTTSDGVAGGYHWFGSAGTSFFVDPSNRLFGIMLTQSPEHRVHLRNVFRKKVYQSMGYLD